MQELTALEGVQWRFVPERTGEYMRMAIRTLSVEGVTCPIMAVARARGYRTDCMESYLSAGAFLGLSDGATDGIADAADGDEYCNQDLRNRLAEACGVE